METKNHKPSDQSSVEIDIEKVYEHQFVLTIQKPALARPPTCGNTLLYAGQFSPDKLN